MNGISHPFAVECRGVGKRWVKLGVFKTEIKAREFCAAERHDDAKRGDITPWTYQIVPRKPRPGRKALTKAPK